MLLQVSGRAVRRRVGGRLVLRRALCGRISIIKCNTMSAFMFLLSTTLADVFPRTLIDDNANRSEFLEQCVPVCGTTTLK